MSVYLIEHPNGEYDKSVQISSLGSRLLYVVNQGKVEKGQIIDEQLLEMGIMPSKMDYVLLSHLDCDNAKVIVMVCVDRELQRT